MSHLRNVLYFAFFFVALSSFAETKGPAWNNDTINNQYGCVVSESCLGSIGNCLTNLSNGAFYTCGMWDSLSSTQAQTLAAQCQTANPCDYMAQLVCAEQAAKTRASTSLTGSAAEGPCGYIASAFDEIVGYLNIPGVNVQLLSFYAFWPSGFSGHGVSLVTIQWNGQVYMYVLDAGWFPGTFFPYNSYAINNPLPKMIPYLDQCMEKVTISGTVLYSNGTPVQNTELNIDSNGQGSWSAMPAAATDQQGNYKFVAKKYPLDKSAFGTTFTINPTVPSDGPKYITIPDDPTGFTPKPVNFTVPLMPMPPMPGMP